MRAALHCYFGQIRIRRVDTIPKEGPLMLLPNHQNALLDALLIATHCSRKPYFLTRSDVFSNALFRSLFSFFRMLPVYRIRDGRSTLQKNEAIFQKCVELLGSGETVLVFPEANHHLDRRVRPLSKGFTRILFQAMEQPEIREILLLPVGLNYYNAAAFPDMAALYYGKAFPISTLYNPEDLRQSAMQIKREVMQQLQTLTTHVPEAMNHDQVINYLKGKGFDFQDPQEANEALTKLPRELPHVVKKSRQPRPPALLKAIFYLINFPLWLPWLWIKKKWVPEPAFASTFRFAYAFLIYPVVYLALFFSVAPYTGYAQALVLVSMHFGCNQLYIKSIRTKR